MRMVTLLIIFLPSLGQACDQRLYDYAYLLISQKVIQSSMTQKDLDWRYETVLKLRVMCNNQLSSWEKGEKNDWNK